MVKLSVFILQSFLVMLLMSSKRRNPAYETKQMNSIRSSASVAQECPWLIFSFARMSDVIGSFRSVVNSSIF